ncbi:MAG: hypothetical protein KGL10_04985 [Alphaproteobacteria bacterium]|nr:hypothetical protein [Alphaproteobacteria bacterium]MDE2336646.1 hypothetical protein [Alphaproteobacteria bacterium]
MKRDKIAHKLAAVLTTGILVGESTAAFATGTNFKDVVSKITDSSSTLPNLISTVAYVGGIGLGVAGVFKLKQHVDNPGQHPMKDGLIRLGAGGALLALPYLTTAMMGTVGATSSGASIPTFAAVSF